MSSHRARARTHWSALVSLAAFGGVLVYGLSTVGPADSGPALVPHAVVVTTGCTAAPPWCHAPAKHLAPPRTLVLAPTPAPSVPRPRPTSTPHGVSVPAVHQPAVQATHKHAVVCYTNAPCDLSKAVWTRTVGCTKAWLKATSNTACPINPKTGQRFPLVG